MKRKENELTSREKEVLKYITLPSKEIAKRLFVERNTIQTHINNILKKFKASNRQTALLKALELGLLKIEEIER